jgi:hypothetical protein
VTGRRESGRASFIAVVSATLVAVLLVLVLVKFLGDRSRYNAEASSAAAASAAAGQAADERAVAAARQKYRRELRFCEALRQFGGADLACLGDFAAEHGDLFFCGEVPAASRSGCIQRVAMATGRAPLCDGIGVPEWRQDCYFHAAAVTSDAGGCEKLAEVPARKACVAIAKGDASACEDVNETTARHGCYRHLAVKTGNSGLCEGVRNRQMPEGFQHELWDCYRDAAVDSRRPEGCDPIPHEGVHVNTVGWHTYRECLDRIETRRAGAECREGPVDLTCRGKTAAARNDLGMCDRLRSYTEMDLCALTFAFRRNDRAACGKIQDGRLKDACLEISGGAAP